MREYLVVHEKGNYCGVSIEPAGKTYPYKMECWAIADGKQFMFARTKLGKIMDKFHLGGNFEKMANYAVSFEDMCAVVKTGMGPSDRERYESSKEISERVSSGARATRQGLILVTTMRALGTFGLIVGRTVRLILVLVLVPFLIMFFNKSRNR